MSTLVIGASLKPYRYSHRAIMSLRAHDEQVYAFGLREGTVADVKIEKDREALNLSDLDTITLYMNPQRQVELYDWMLSLKPKRVIFNPGTENPELIQMLQAEGIETLAACTLVMLSTGQYSMMSTRK